MKESLNKRNDCRLCGDKKLKSIISLTSTPPANAFITKEQINNKQACFPLEVFFCENCSHVQMLDIIDPKILFENYVYISGTSPVFINHFQDYANNVIKKFPELQKKFVIDIGSNDGTLLRFFKEAGFSVLGIDPAKDIARRANELGIETVTGFISSELAKKIRKEKGRAQIITANNVFAHSDDLKAIVESVSILLDDSGIFIIEVSYLLDVLEKNLFDTIYHEHLAYHSIKPLSNFFLQNDFELIDILRVNSHGGSVRVIVQKKSGSHPISQSVSDILKLEKEMKLDKIETYYIFSENIKTLKEELQLLLNNLKEDGKSIAAFGAPAKATTLMYHFDIGPEIIDFIVDDSPLKQGLFSPGKHIEIVSSSEIEKRNPDYLLILAWNFSESIMKKHSDFKSRGGHFITPLPTIQVH